MLKQHLMPNVSGVAPVTGTKQGFSLARKIAIFGNPYHGLVEDGILALPNATIRNYPWLAGLASTRRDTFNQRASIPMRKPGQPVPVRTPAQQAADTAIGFQWKNYAQVVGQERYVWGVQTIGEVPNAMRLGPMGWIYWDPGGTAWKIEPTNDADRFIFGTTPPPGDVFSFFLPRNIEFTIKKWAYFASTPAKQAVQAALVFTHNLNIPMFQFIPPEPITTQFLVAPPAPTLSSATHAFFIGTHSLDGSFLTLHLVNQLAFQDLGGTTPQFRKGAGDLLGTSGGSLAGGFTAEGSPVAWSIACSGTPGVDFNMVLNEEYSVYNQTRPSGDINGFVGNDSGGGPVHIWITPAGLLEFIVYSFSEVGTPLAIPDDPNPPIPIASTYTLTQNWATPCGNFGGTLVNDRPVGGPNVLSGSNAFPFPDSCQSFQFQQVSVAGGPLIPGAVTACTVNGSISLPQKPSFENDLWFVAIEGISPPVLGTNASHYFGGAENGGLPRHHNVFV